MNESMTSAFTTAINGVKTDSLDLITKALPVGLTIMGVVLAITIGMKVFKKVTNK